ncbi:RbsD/FucU family protein [Vibrio gallicus]|uniref:RbsD/FucU family protein n=1 Tax=Vibrio gallicus TaxID=190897 RepID=UPI0021C46A14|nr:RbsD/FucU family protein [Vibrio gallicus]
MIKSDIIHPELLSVLAKCGHKTQILIADSNYSFVTNSPKDAKVIYLNLSKDMIPSTIILSSLVKMINIERATMMAWPDNFENTIESEYKSILDSNKELELLERQEFYSTVKSPNTLLVIASGETRRFANLLLTVAPV